MDIVKSVFVLQFTCLRGHSTSGDGGGDATTKTIVALSFPGRLESSPLRCKFPITFLTLLIIK